MNIQIVKPQSGPQAAFIQCTADVVCYGGAPAELLEKEMVDAFVETFPNAPLAGLVEVHTGHDWELDLDPEKLIFIDETAAS